MALCEIKSEWQCIDSHKDTKTQSHKEELIFLLRVLVALCETDKWVTKSFIKQ